MGKRVMSVKMFGLRHRRMKFTIACLAALLAVMCLAQPAFAQTESDDAAEAAAKLEAEDDAAAAKAAEEQAQAEVEAEIAEAEAAAEAETDAAVRKGASDIDEANAAAEEQQKKDAAEAAAAQEKADKAADEERNKQEAEKAAAQQAQAAAEATAAAAREAEEAKAASEAEAAAAEAEESANAEAAAAAAEAEAEAEANTESDPEADARREKETREDFERLAQEDASAAALAAEEEAIRAAHAEASPTDTLNEMAEDEANALALDEGVGTYLDFGDILLQKALGAAEAAGLPASHREHLTSPARGISETKRRLMMENHTAHETCSFECAASGTVPVSDELHNATALSDGCGAPGLRVNEDFPFHKCCHSHDVCYGTCNTNKNRCDLDFIFCMNSTCNYIAPNDECRNAAVNLFDDTVALSQEACTDYVTSQSRSCTCVPGKVDL